MLFLSVPVPTIQLTIDAREVTTHVVHVQLTIPVKAGGVTLEYPKWIPGMHEPIGPVCNVVNLRFVSQGKVLPWKRDPYDFYGFTVTVPRGVNQLEATFDYLPRVGETDEIAYGVAATEHLAVINPSALILTPRGTDISNGLISTRMLLPERWKSVSALPEGEPATVERRADSPIFLGQYAKVIDLPSPDRVPHQIAVFSESEEGTTPNGHVLACLQKLVRESALLFGARHYQQFTFLLALTNGLPQYGLEHHASTVNVLRPSALGDGTALPSQWNANLLPHEFVHSWNGKYRRPYGLATNSFNKPLSTDLLWVYEGLTEYLGEVLMVRCGFYPMEAEREHLRQQLISLDSRPIRTTQSLRDAALAYPLISAKGDGRRLRWSNDVYYESALHWLEADTIIRQESGGNRSLDDFCRAFFGGVNRGAEVKSYHEEDIVRALRSVLPTYDWKRWLTDRFSAVEPLAPRAGLERAGWRVRLGEAQDSRRTFEAESDFRFSLGFFIGRDGRISEVQANSLAARSGLIPGMRITQIGDKLFSPRLLRDSVKRSLAVPVAISLQVEERGKVVPVTLTYQGGEKLPLLERDVSKPDLLDSIFHGSQPK